MQGFNQGRYVPPELEGVTTGNKIHKRRAPGTLRKDGTQTVRFEMPYANAEQHVEVWCHTCQPHAIIGQGVRFNAVKKRVGSYYSTPIWEFTLRHPACSGTITIRTDPQNTAYIVISGGKARDYGTHDEDRLREGEGGVPILTPAERERRREDAFANLEGKVEEQKAVEENSKRLAELYEAQERDWRDPAEVNKRMRRTFRAERKVREKKAQEDERLQERLGTGLEILPETEEDARRAALVEFGESVEDAGEDLAAGKALFVSRPVMKDRPSPASTSGRASGKAREGAREILRRRLQERTRATSNPFNADTKTAR